MDQNCTLRFSLNETNVDPVYWADRYPNHYFLEAFLPRTLLFVRILMITWLTVGIFGNMLSFAIWITRHQRRKNTSAIYLTALSLSDLILILTYLDYHLKRYWDLPNVADKPIMCQVINCLTFFSQYYSNILVFGFTLERYLSVCYPFKRHKLCTSKRAVIAVIILAAICAVPMLFQAVLWSFQDGVCQMRIDFVGESNLQTILIIQETLFSLLIPLAALVFNIMLVFEMHRLIRSTAMPSSSTRSHGNSIKRTSCNGTVLLKLLSKRHKSDTSNARSSSCYEPAQNSLNEQKSTESANFISTSIMLAILSFYLIACAVPPGVTYLIQFLIKIPDPCLTKEAMLMDPEWQKYVYQLQSKELMDVLCASHYALNFFIYLFTSKSFREHVYWIMSCNVRKLKRLSNPRTESWVFPRRTGPRLVRSFCADESRSLVGGPTEKPRHASNPNGNTPF
ncbi:Growth hormone secretagogue receptor [Paragonimus heterotremus]|uniref:Growth hormone secretagogue receptor n=1 Tax=Paragonimus heterotremus TaxID=100268 RepID=A0A8J4TEP6_9TREM|nr:Growth hormone secretagogue receptor [Paragonimus heterotremus]